jgi:hypothetical protein
MRIRMGLVLGLLLALGAAGCGSADGDDDPVATAGGGRPTSSANGAQLSIEESALKFAQCMREHGIDLPDPQDGRLPNIPEGADPKKVDDAQQQCKQYLPTGGEERKNLDPQRVDALRKIAQCMRENGFPNFPDPNENGNLALDPQLGLDPKDARFQAAEKVCNRYAPTDPSGSPAPGQKSNG